MAIAFTLLPLVAINHEGGLVQVALLQGCQPVMNLAEINELAHHHDRTAVGPIDHRAAGNEGRTPITDSLDREHLVRSAT
jgi:hypothetical protein